MLTGFLNQLLPVVVTAAVAWVSAHIGLLLRSSATAKRVDAAINIHSLIQELAAQSLNYVAGLAKQGATTFDHAAQANRALEYAMSLAKTLGLDKLAEEELRKVIIARIGAK